MKPPPRKRVKVDRDLVVEPVSCSFLSKWQPPEKRKLLKALNRLSKANGGNVDIDYSFLKTCIVTRSMSEIQGVVESLKEKVITGTMSELNKWKSERKLRKPIEVWTEMAFSVTGSHEEHISTAFSQMLMVSSTEPCTLASCDPPQVLRPPSNLIERTLPPRPILHMPVQVKSKASPVNQRFLETQSAANLLAAEKSPAPLSLANTTSVQQSAPPHPSSGSPAVVLPPTISVLPVSGVAPSPPAHNVTTSSPLSAAAIPTQLGHTGKYASKDAPRKLGVKCAVDFEKLYRYLSEIHKPDKEWNLTPMENAIVLDLLMSLPEELLLLDCNKLHKHLIEVYKCLSSPADSRDAKEKLEKIKSTFAGQEGAQSSLAENDTTAQQSAAVNADAAADGGQEPQQNESVTNQNTPNQSSNTVETGFSPPPLNPFMIPLEMLMRR